MLYWILKTIFGPVINLFWIKNVDGLENIPDGGPIIVVANHSSYFDFLSLIAVFKRRIYFLTAEKFYKNIFWRPLVAFTGQIMVDRKNSDKQDVYKRVFSLLKNNQVVGIFPEGTRSQDGKTGKAFVGAAKFAIKAKVPVLPVAIAGAFEVMSRHDKFPKIKKNISIKIGKPMYFEDYYKKEDSEEAFSEATEKIMQEIEKLKHDIMDK